MIPQPTSSPPKLVPLSSASRSISSGWSGSITAELKKALDPDSVNNADPSPASAEIRHRRGHRRPRNGPRSLLPRRAVDAPAQRDARR
jgi:hypothetical protein